MARRSSTSCSSSRSRAARYADDSPGNVMPSAPFSTLRRTRSFEIPAEVDLCATDLVAFECEDFGVAEPISVGLRALVGHDDLVAGLDEPLELEGLDQLGVRPAALEVPSAIDAQVGRAVEREVVGQKVLDDAAIAGFVGAIAVSSDLHAVLVRHVPPPSLAGSVRVDRSTRRDSSPD